jgi:hypothetical protein
VLDVDGDGRDEIVAAPGPGAGYWSHVRTFRYAGNAVAAVPGGSFHAFPGPTHGAHPAGGQGILVVAPGPGPSQPSRVLGFAYGSGTYAPLPGFDATVYPGLVYGAGVALASIDAAGYLEAVTAPGPGPAYQAHVRALAYSGSATQLLARPSFLAYGPAFRYGGNVASLTLD